MSSKRGRKRNDNLPPNRARDVQRAFRARRAAHLQALEQRVTELEEENSCLRQALNLPPANRAPLGKGPTGKDKPKTFDAGGSLALHSSRDSSSADSPGSTRTSSLSPAAITTSMPTRSVQVIQDDGTWEQTILIHDQPPSDAPSSSSSSGYQLPPMSTPLSSKSLQYPSFPSPLPSSARPSLPNNMYSMNSQGAYPHSADRPMGTYSPSPGFVMRSDVREEQRQYSYSQTSFSSHENGMHSQNSSAGPVHIQSTHHPHPQRESPLPYIPRRSHTEPQQHFSSMNPNVHLPPMQSHGIRLPSPPLQDNTSHTPLPSRIYASDGRIHTMS